MPVPPEAAALRAAGIASPLADLLAQRGAGDPGAARRLLSPALDQLSPAAELPGLDAAASRLQAVAAAGGRVLVVGDYDVDGVAATALMSATLGALGADVRTHLPRRDEEGYGLQPIHVRHAAAAGARLLVAVDSGTTAYPAWEEASRLGVELVVVDHHLGESQTPDREAPIVVNPRRGPAPAAARDLTAAGLTARLAATLFERSGREVPWDGLLRLACLGTVADVAPLTGDNRVLVALGLEALARTPSPGLRALLRIASLRPPIAASDVAFRLAPRLNAAGRLASADEALELVLTRDRERAEELAARLERRNGERQSIEARILAEARRRLEARGEPPPLVLLSSPDWHAGVVGIAAARLARECHRPTILLAERDGFATGSGRSVAGLPLHELVAPAAADLERFGGHAQAIGLTVATDRVDALRRRLEAAAAAWSAQLATRELRYDFELPLAAVGHELVAAIGSLEPFGAGNPEPIFRVGPCVVAGSPEPFGRGHLRFEVAGRDGGARRRVVWWRGAETGGLSDDAIELLAGVEADRYGGVRLRLVDHRSVGAASD